jgi:predicted DNA-binding protein with PD1-like motif
MEWRVLHEHGGLRTVVLVLQTGDEVMATVSSFAAAHHLAATHFTGIGALSGLKVAYFDWATKAYQHIPIDEQVEVLSLAGDITLDEGKPKVHAHIVVGKRDGSAHGGHLVEGAVRPTLELVLVEAPVHLRRRFDPASRLALIDARA